MAEREGFEPSDSCPSPHFQCGAFDHSTISPLVLRFNNIYPFLIKSKRDIEKKRRFFYDVDEKGEGMEKFFLKKQLKIGVMTCTVYRVIYIIYSKKSRRRDVACDRKKESIDWGRIDEEEYDADSDLC